MEIPGKPTSAYCGHGMYVYISTPTQTKRSMQNTLEACKDHNYWYFFWVQCMEANYSRTSIIQTFDNLKSCGDCSIRVFSFFANEFYSHVLVCVCTKLHLIQSHKGSSGRGGHPTSLSMWHRINYHTLLNLLKPFCHVRGLM